MGAAIWGRPYRDGHMGIKIDPNICHRWQITAADGTSGRGRGRGQMAARWHYDGGDDGFLLVDGCFLLLQ
jgi:hypothetical protein